MKQYHRIDYAFRPKSYWTDSDPLSAILRNVKGENRRRMIRDHWRAGKLDELDPGLLGEEVDAETRERLGRIHPSFMGGEYMPGYQTDLPVRVGMPLRLPPNGSAHLMG
jgi:hypothetical protein